jgi:hypothetical protein
VRWRAYGAGGDSATPTRTRPAGRQRPMSARRMHRLGARTSARAATWSADIVCCVPALNLAGRFPRYGRRRRLPWAVRCAAHKRRSPCLASFPQVPRSIPQRESQRRSRSSSLTKINAGLHAAAGAEPRRLAGMTCPRGAFDLACAHTLSWECNASTTASRRPLDQSGYVPSQHAGGRERSELRPPAFWRCLRDRRTTGFPQIRAVRAVRCPFWLDGTACQGNREGE